MSAVGQLQILRLKERDLAACHKRKKEMQSHVVLPENFRLRERERERLPINRKDKNKCNCRKIEYELN
jgi:hypothetical protein